MADLSVLIVDDERRLRELLGRAVARMGFDVQAVASAEDAAAAMKRRPHAIVMLDLNLPGKNWAAFMDDLHRWWPATRVIIITGFADLDSALKAVRHNAADYVTKPFDLGDIERALDRARRQIELNGRPPARGAAGAGDHAAGSLAAMERQLIVEALQRHGGNRTAAADELGITRRTLYNKLKHYRIQPDGASRKPS